LKPDEAAATQHNRIRTASSQQQEFAATDLAEGQMCAVSAFFLLLKKAISTQVTPLQNSLNRYLKNKSMTQHT
jgi:hypothetical protein